jgi:hypothetical protein
MILFTEGWLYFQREKGDGEMAKSTRRLITNGV